jgi:hypothetical protein
MVAAMPGPGESYSDVILRLGQVVVPFQLASQSVGLRRLRWIVSGLRARRSFARGSRSSVDVHRGGPSYEGRQGAPLWFGRGDQFGRGPGVQGATRPSCGIGLFWARHRAASCALSKAQ